MHDHAINNTIPSTPRRRQQRTRMTTLRTLSFAARRPLPVQSANPTTLSRKSTHRACQGFPLQQKHENGDDDDKFENGCSPLPPPNNTSASSPRTSLVLPSGLLQPKCRSTISMLTHPVRLFSPSHCLSTSFRTNYNLLDVFLSYILPFSVRSWHVITEPALYITDARGSS